MRSREKAMAGLPQKLRERLIKQSSIRIDLFTEFILKDIGMYVSSFFLKNYPGLEWIFKRTPKNYVHVNQPLLYGFKDNSIKNPKPFELEPINFVELRAVKLIRDVQPQEEDLYIACKEWAQWAPKN